MKLYKYLKEQKEAQLGITTEAEGLHDKHYHDKHYHKYEVNEYGNGKTINTINGEDGHIHNIVKWKVKKAHNHTHEINNNHKKY